MRSLIGLVLCLLVHSTVQAVVPDPEPCLRTLSTSFFQEQTVSEALALYSVPQGLWFPINQTLRASNIHVPERLRQAAAAMQPNPLLYPMQRLKVAALLKNVLRASFIEALRRNSAVQQPVTRTVFSFDDMFEYIFARELPRFTACFGPEASKLAREFD